MQDSDFPATSMNGKELLRALLLDAKLTPEEFASKLGRPALINEIHCYLDGVIRNPSWAIFKPVASYFNIRISALFDTAVAEQVARERGFIRSDALIRINAADYVDLVTASPARSAGNLLTSAIPIYDLILLMAAAVKPHSGSVKIHVASLFQSLVRDNVTPEETQLIAAQIEVLLQAPGTLPKI